MDCAPIVIITYSRIEHLKKTIASLKNNDLAIKSELYIFIDGPKPGDEEKVSIVNEYSTKIRGFKKVHVVAREVNDRVENYFNGAEFVLQTYGKMIFLEDDNIVSPMFLRFMNAALVSYENNYDIISISGYNVPAYFPVSYKYDCYKSK